MLQKFNFLKKVLKKLRKTDVLKVTPWGMLSLVYLDNWMTVRKWYDFAMIWARQRCGEIPGQELFRVKRQKEAFDMYLMKLPYRQNKTHYRRKNHQKSTRKATVKRSVIVIPRMTKSKKSEWSLFLNERNRISYNELCKRCVKSCKQSFRAVVISCNYVSKRSVKNIG